MQMGGGNHGQDAHFSALAIVHPCDACPWQGATLRGISIMFG
jgi:hypothetical protein